MNTELLDAAQAYNEQGFAVIPFILNPKNGKKEPDTFKVPQWKQWQTQPQTRTEFENLHIENYSMFGLVCGAPIEKDGEKVFFVGIDRDIKDPEISEETKQKTLDALNNMKPYTHREKTRSGGNHLGYYSRKPVEGKKLNDIGMELLGTGNLMVMAPSEGYTTENDNGISTVEDAGAIFYKALQQFGLYTDKPTTVFTPKNTFKPAPLRPCFAKLMEKPHLEHLEKVALIYEMYYCGMSIDEVVEIFQEHQAWEPAPEHIFNARKTASQISYTYNKAKEGSFRYKSETLAGTDLKICYPECPLRKVNDCRRLHPTIEELRQNNQIIEKICQGDLNDYPTAEDALADFIAILYSYDFSVREVKETLTEIKCEKWISGTDFFKEKIFRKADKITTEETPQDTSEQESQADRLVKLCLKEKIELFSDQHNTAFARVKMVCDTLRNCDICATSVTFARTDTVGDIESKTDPVTAHPSNTSKVTETPQTPQYRNVTMAIGSSQFKQWLSYLMWIAEEKAPGNDSLNSASNVLKGKAQQEGKQYTLYNRVAPAENGIWLDMCDDNWRAIIITEEGWKIVDNPPILFKRYSHQQPLIEPTQEGDAWKLLDYTNIKDSDEKTRLSFLVSVISYLIPLIPHPAIVVSGSQGSAKSWLLKLVKRTIDPSSIELLTLPRDERELAQQLEHHWIAAYDNMTSLPTWASDMFCRSVTGGGIAVRKLYSDDEDTILNFKRCILLNGINVAAQRGDLLDRSELIALEPIAKENRKTEEDLNRDFDKAKPIILAGFLNALSIALKKYPSVELDGYQRLADFNRYGCAIAEGLGKTQQEFTDAYANKVEQQNEEALNADPIALIILKVCQCEVKKRKLINADGTETLDCRIWQPTELYATVKNYAQTIGIDVKSKQFPKSPNALTRRINDASPALKVVGVLIENFAGTPRKIKIDASKLKAEDQEEIISIHALEVLTCLETCWKCQSKKSLAYEVKTVKGTHQVCNDCAEPILKQIAEVS